MMKNKLGKEELNYTSTALFITKGSHDKQGKILEAEADIEAMEFDLLSLYFPFTQTAFL